MPTRLIQSHDAFAKQILDEPGHADAFLRAHLPPQIVQRLSDTPAIDRSESHISAELRDLRGDRVYSMETIDGDRFLVWTMLEHKAWPETDTMLQLLRDLTGIARKGAGTRTNPDGTVWRVPAPVYCVVLYHGVPRWPLPTALTDAYGLPNDLANLGFLSFVYRLIDLITIPDEDLPSLPSLRAALMVLKYALYDGDPRITLDRLIEAAATFGLTTLIVVVRYLVKDSAWIDVADIRTRVARLMPGEEDKVMSPAMRQILDEGRPKIIAEEKPRIIAEEKPRIIAEEKPRIEADAMATTLLRQIGRKFGTPSTETIERVRTADMPQLEGMADKILDATSLEDVFRPAPTQ